MANESRPRGLRNDPRLVERRGDLRGLSALVFVALLLMGFALVAFLLFVVTRPGPPPVSPSPFPTPTATPTPVTEPTSSPSPSGSPGPGTGVIDGTVGAPAALVQGDVAVGRVTVLSTEFSRRINGQNVPQGSRWLVANIRYRASTPLEYDAARWFVADDAGKRYEWRGSGDPNPALGVGTLDAGKVTTGNVTFTVPTGTRIATLILTDDAGKDLIRFALK